MKKILFAFVFAMLSFSVNAQSWDNNLMLDLTVGAGVGTKNEQLIVGDVGFGYRFIPRAYVFFLYDVNVGLLKIEGEKTYTETNNLGGGLGYTLWRKERECGRGFDIDLSASLVATVGHTDWKQVAYDVDLSFKKHLGINIKVGYKHVQSRTAGIKNFDGVVLKIGFCF